MTLPWFQPEPAGGGAVLAARGIDVSYEPIREWGLRFGREFANALKRRRPKPDDQWLLDEVFIRIRGKPHYLWRAIDQNGVVLDIWPITRHSAGKLTTPNRAGSER